MSSTKKSFGFSKRLNILSDYSKNHNKRLDVHDEEIKELRSYIEHLEKKFDTVTISVKQSDLDNTSKELMKRLKKDLTNTLSKDLMKLFRQIIDEKIEEVYNTLDTVRNQLRITQKQDKKKMAGFGMRIVAIQQDISSIAGDLVGIPSEDSVFDDSEFLCKPSKSKLSSMKRGRTPDYSVSKKRNVVKNMNQSGGEKVKLKVKNKRTSRALVPKKR